MKKALIALLIMIGWYLVDPATFLTAWHDIILVMLKIPPFLHWCVYG